MQAKIKHKLPKQMKILGFTIGSTIQALLNHSVSQSIGSMLLKLIINFGGQEPKRFIS